MPSPSVVSSVNGSELSVLSLDVNRPPSLQSAGSLTEGLRGSTARSSLLSQPAWRRFRKRLGRRGDRRTSVLNVVEEDSEEKAPSPPQEAETDTGSTPAQSRTQSRNDSPISEPPLWHNSPHVRGAPPRGGMHNSPSVGMDALPVANPHPLRPGQFYGLGGNASFEPSFSSFNFAPPPGSIYSASGTPRPRSIPERSRLGYVAGDPFKSPHTAPIELPTTIPHNTSTSSITTTAKWETLFRQVFTLQVFTPQIRTINQNITTLLDTALRQTYHSLFLRLPAFYFVRVTRIFHDVQLNADDLRDVVVQHLANQKSQGPSVTRTQQYFINPADAPQMSDLIFLWEGFIDSLMREWKTINIVSVMLLTAIISMLQIDAVFTDHVVRDLLLIALVCGLMSVIYGCIYIIRFSGMRRVHRAVEWAKEGAAKKTAIFWNPWVLLAMPSVWLAWTLILFIAVVVTFVWREDLPDDQKSISPGGKKAFHWVLTVILTAGIGYLALIIRSLRRYGEHMDIKWTEAIKEKAAEIILTGMASPRGLPSHMDLRPPNPNPPGLYPPFHLPPQQAVPVSSATHSNLMSSITSWANPASSQTSLLPSPAQRPGMNLGAKDILQDPVEVIKLDSGRILPEAKAYIPHLLGRGITEMVWLNFSEDISNAWTVSGYGMRQADLIKVVDSWNKSDFHRMDFEVVLIRETPEAFPRFPSFAVFLTDLLFSYNVADRIGVRPGILEVVAWADSQNPPYVRMAHVGLDQTPPTRWLPNPLPPLTSPLSPVGITVESPSTDRSSRSRSPMSAKINEHNWNVPAIKPVSSSPWPGPEVVESQASPTQPVQRNPIAPGLPAIDQSQPPDAPFIPPLVTPSGSPRHVTFSFPDDISPPHSADSREAKEVVDFTSSLPNPSQHSREESRPNIPSISLPLPDEVFSDLDMTLKSPKDDEDDLVLGPLQEFPHSPLVAEWHDMIMVLSMFRFQRVQPGVPSSVIFIDLRKSPETTTFRKCSESDLARSVTMPPTDKMELIHRSYPGCWHPIIIKSTRDEGISTQDLISQIWEEMNTVVTPSELDELGPEDRLEVMHAHNDRITSGPVETLEVRRVDFLKGCVIFSGLILENGRWEILSREPDTTEEGDLTAYLPVSESANSGIS